MVETNFLFKNIILNASVCGWFVAQLLKVLFSLFKGKLDISRFTGSGGMPSSHSATVLALATSTYLTCGAQSAEFAITLVLASIVMYDATGVRRAAGEQAKTLNFIMEHWNFTTPKEFTKELKELLGHTPIEVIVGGILGIFIGIIVVGL